VSSVDVFGTALRLLLRLEELRSSATEQHEILVAQMQVQVRRNPAKNKSLTTEKEQKPNHRKRHDERYSCSFSFYVGNDRHGYYIPLFLKTHSWHCKHRPSTVGARWREAPNNDSL
jgi:hypothetical protein